MIHLNRVAARLLAVSTVGFLLLAACAPGVPATLCHATGDPANPYELVAVTSANAAAAAEHLQHPGDFGPAPVGGCPTEVVEVTNGTIAICHATGSETDPYDALTVSAFGLGGHAAHEGDLIPVPEGGCPGDLIPTGTGTAVGKITICHATSSAKNPYNEITVSVNGLNGHDKHPGDIIPAPAEGCPKP